MHDNSMKLMKEFVEEYNVKDMVVLDMGSQNINGSYRNLFGSGYIGVDIVGGLNVEVIYKSVLWDMIHDVDVVISGQTLEHVEDTQDFMASIFEKLKPGGLICIIAPSAGPEHYNPIWSGHFSTEKMSEVIEDAGFEIIDCMTDDNEPFKDTRCIARKPSKKKRSDENK